MLGDGLEVRLIGDLSVVRHSVFFLGWCLSNSRDHRSCDLIPARAIISGEIRPLDHVDRSVADLLDGLDVGLVCDLAEIRHGVLLIRASGSELRPRWLRLPKHSARWWRCFPRPR